MAYGFQVQKAVRTNVAAKIALMAPAGGGKTFSSLRLATGMIKQIEKTKGKKAKVLMGNTEGARGRYYAKEFEYDIVDLTAPYEPEMFAEFIKYAEESGYDVLIIDSTSPEWDGEGGCLELHARAGGKYQDWGKVTPRHEKFLKAIANANIHIIATMRGKDQYEIEKEDGKTTIKKLGVGAKQRDGFEYEFTCTFNIDQATSIATPQKDNTHIFDSRRAQKLTEEDGMKIIEWAESGEAVNTELTFKADKAEAEEANTDTDELKDMISQVDVLAKSLAENGVDRTAITDAIKKYHLVNGKPTPNYKTIKTLEVAQSVLAELNTLEA